MWLQPYGLPWYTARHCTCFPEDAKWKLATANPRNWIAAKLRIVPKMDRPLKRMRSASVQPKDGPLNQRGLSGLTLGMRRMASSSLLFRGVCLFGVWVIERRSQRAMMVLGCYLPR